MRGAAETQSWNRVLICQRLQGMPCGHGQFAVGHGQFAVDMVLVLLERGLFNDVRMAVFFKEKK